MEVGVDLHVQPKACLEDPLVYKCVLDTCFQAPLAPSSFCSETCVFPNVKAIFTKCCVHLLRNPSATFYNFGQLFGNRAQFLVTVPES